MANNSTMRAVPSDWMDVSVGLRDGMVHWPDNPPVKISRFLDIHRGDVANVSQVSMGLHTGTHMDAPIHFLASGAGMDQLPLTAVMGPARVIHIKDKHVIDVDEVKAHRPRKGERILFRTRNSARRWASKPFMDDFVYLSSAAARFLVARGVRTVGIDYLSIGGMDNGAECHGIILNAGLWVIEGLDLARAPAGRYDLICLPLKVVDGDGSPARAILRPRR